MRETRRFGHHEDGKPMLGFKEILVGAVATVIAAGVIGFFSSWLTASTFRTEAEFRIKALEKNLVEIEQCMKNERREDQARIEKIRSEWMLEVRGLRSDFKDLAKEVRAYLTEKSR